jgi:hypothetical protein
MSKDPHEQRACGSLPAKGGNARSESTIPRLCTTSEHSNPLHQPFKKNLLPGKNPLPGLVQRKPPPPIDFRKHRHSSRTRRPFHRKRIALQARRIAIALNRPRRHNLPPSLLLLTQRDEITFRNNASLFLKFTLRSLQRVFIRIEFSFRNRPRTHIFLRPERPTRMRKQNFHSTLRAAIHQQASAAFRHKNKDRSKNKRSEDR